MAKYMPATRATRGGGVIINGMDTAKYMPATRATRSGGCQSLQKGVLYGEVHACNTGNTVSHSRKENGMGILHGHGEVHACNTEWGCHH